ncbi:DAK2 domain fusion protein YloV [Kibdelosporangium banguiense]|uniref:DAK2 domain fusion protein YloV n=1 Tax=Kibdelosporangium banguiense TaxID=1365924 RepID=A0ABS4TH55_9PSEU|nr:DAK2 domain fusion protein YloV [Kibdelosporangium banguiense]
MFLVTLARAAEPREEPTVLQALDAAAIRRWAAVCVRSLDAQRDAIDGINVFPVADGDTGSNLLGTMRAALEALLRAPVDERSEVGAALTVLAKGALAGARGNSGVIVSQMLRGLAEALRDIDQAGAVDLGKALVRAAELAAGAVAEPRAGTMLTVLTASAAAARRVRSGVLHEVTAAAARAAGEALVLTPQQLDVLAEAGVVDAGGRGVLVLLESLVTVVNERDEPVVPYSTSVQSPVAAREAGSAEFGYEVMYLLDSTTDKAAIELRDKLGQLGDCVSVVGDGAGLWTVHVHCNDIGAAIEAGVETGRPHRIMVARFADAEGAPTRFGRARVVVIPARGAGIAALFRGEGALVLEIGPNDEPDVWDLLNLITSTGASHVTVLPGDEGLVGIADEAATRAVAGGQDVVVIPCASPVQALAALAVHDPARRSGDDVVSMAEASAATRRGELVVTSQDAITWIGPCQAGDLLGFADGDVMRIEHGPVDAAMVIRGACAVVDRMLGAGGELVTAMLGADAPEHLADELEKHLRSAYPAAEFVAYRGGQRDSVLMLGVE